MPDGQERAQPRAAGGTMTDREALLREQVERALIDVALLRTFVSSRNDVSLGRAFTDAEFPAKPPEETQTRDAFLQRLSEIEQTDVATLAHEPKSLAFLFAARDTLNAVAAPADAYTVAFTGFYTGSLA